MILKFALFVLVLLAVTALLPSTAMAWTGAVHDYMCPEGYNIDCKIADTADFQENYPYGGFQYHFCYDNKADGMARLVAKYYLKKYYVEGQQDVNLLGAAAHLLQDASCPDHWYPLREIFGRIIVPFAPSWVGTIEDQVQLHLEKYEKDWSISIEFQGRTITIDDDYLQNQKAYIENYLSHEPEESLEEIQKQIDARSFWSGMRSYKEWIVLCAIVTVPFLAYEMWTWIKKEKTTRKLTDSIGITIVSSVLAVLLILFILIQLFY